MPDDVTIPEALKAGRPMQKISSKKIKQVVIRIEDGAICWPGSRDGRIPIDQIRELRMGQPPTDNTPAAASRWITVVYVRESQWKVLHMIALTDESFKLWSDTLSQLVSVTSDRTVGQIATSDPDSAWIRQLWPAGAKCIDWPTAVGLCRSIGLPVPEGKSSETPLDLSTFRQLVKEVQTRPELEKLHKEMSEEGPLDQTVIDRFLSGIQKLDPGGIFEQFHHDDVWTIDSLSDFLSSPISKPPRKPDMTRPLSEYYISSSHNTYLVGEQWRGESTVEGYIRVLLADCRCVEIDIHDGEIEPVAYHKKTLTTPVAVRDICHAIKNYAFISSPYPVIISAETHCSTVQQDRLATIMRDVLGDKLITQRIDDSTALPSPEALKGKILFKTKPPAEPKPAEKPMLSPKDSIFSFDSTTTSDTSESDSGLSRLRRRLSINGKQPEKPTFSPALSDLLVYTHGVKYQGFSKLVEYEPKHQFSMSERTGGKLAKDNKADWIKHNFTHLSRVYPKGFRLTSTNYDPLPFWEAGCQLVAVNWQTTDAGATMNHALFVDTDGYVLKPLFLRQRVIESVTKYRVRLTIISAQRLPLSSDLYVEATLGSSTRRTACVLGRALNPVWNEALSFTIECTPSMLDLQFLKIEIRQPNNKTVLAQWMRTITASPRGFQYLPLYDALCSKFVFATLFVRIEVEPVSSSG